MQSFHFYHIFSFIYCINNMTEHSFFDILSMNIQVGSDEEYVENILETAEAEEVAE